MTHLGLGATLRRARSTAGLSQAAVAATAGVDQSMISVYEHERRDPTWDTFRRLLMATGAVAEVRVDTLPDTALTLVQLAEQLAATGDNRRRRRLVLEFVGRFMSAPHEHRRSLVAERPVSTGDKRWDALLGALAEHLAFHEAIDAPAWCTDNDRFLESAWYFVDLPSVRRRAFAATPTSFRRRNVWLDRADLERR
jgi:transcriptional regulator with XRE-family HTH domain